ncbi:hypothetical protein GCM10009679_21080 [Saccharothrix algeriensis]|uniref:Uncharacterized protein n=2 Tax=Catellatospora bangladeshensis TaxID=310355 RepID=A0A8J3JG37_9ACTN|nr:hypothetical protein Cba03nite_33680 [Catellatospora bangladeshensis]
MVGHLTADGTAFVRSRSTTTPVHLLAASETAVMTVSRRIGRATVARHIGRARPRTIDPPAAAGVAAVAADATRRMPAPAPIAPVFVDDTGRRRGRIRIVVLAVAALLVAAAAAVWLSISAAPVHPDPAPAGTCPTASGPRCAR